MIDRAQIVPIARTYLGTPYHHEGGVKGVGVDCARLLACVFEECGGQVGVRASGLPKVGDVFEIMCGEIEQVCELVEGLEYQPNDVLVFRTPAMPNHVALCTGETMIHAHSGVGWVVEEPISEIWRKRLVRVYRLRGDI